ncbi:DUF3604 domain-containing protein [bacterium]|nr:DUF3604 domain-containing protein [bacterium]
MAKKPIPEAKPPGLKALSDKEFQRFPFYIPEFERPIRIPESVKIEKANPPFAIAGKYGEWELKFVISKKIKKGEIIKFQISGGRNNKGFFPVQTKHPEKEGYITAYFKGKNIPVEETENNQTFILKIDEKIEKGETIRIILGDRSKGCCGIRAPEMRLLNKFFVLYKDKVKFPDAPRTGGFSWNTENQKKIISACVMHILGGKTHHLRAYAPSYVKPGKKFHILIRPEDKYNNLSCEKISEITVYAGKKQIDGKIKKIKKTTCIKFQTSIEKEGVYRFKIKDKRGNVAYTNPVIITEENYLNLYWGMIHGHTENSDGCGTINYYFHQIKNEAGLDFGAPGDHDHLWEITDNMWKKICEAVKKWNKEKEFITFLGYEWAKWRQNGDGDRNVYYFKDNRQMYRSDDTEYPSPRDLFRVLKREKAIIIPHHTACAGNWCDWKDHEKEKERLVEIYQVRGSYESYKNNPLPPEESRGKNKKIGFVNVALKKGWRVGFTSGGDDHIGHAGTEFLFGKYKQGIFGVFAKNLTRKGIWNGLWNRRTVATTGARIILFYKLNHFFMGNEIPISENPALEKSREFYIEFHGTAPLKQIDIIRNGEIIHSFKKEKNDLKVKWKDTEPIEEIFFPETEFSEVPFIYYYVRVIQKDGEVAWASPVWILKR